jgi:hypothetical protein
MYLIDILDNAIKFFYDIAYFRKSPEKTMCNYRSHDSLHLDWTVVFLLLYDILINMVVFIGIGHLFCGLSVAWTCS